MKFLWSHNIVAWAPNVISQITRRGEIFEGDCSPGKVVKKMGWDLFEIPLVRNYAERIYARLIYWVGVTGGTNGQRNIWEWDGVLPNHAALRGGRRDTMVERQTFRYNSGATLLVDD